MPGSIGLIYKIRQYFKPIFVARGLIFGRTAGRKNLGRTENFQTDGQTENFGTVV